MHALERGTVALGVFGEPSAWRLEQPVAAFMRRHPGVAVRLVGPNAQALGLRLQPKVEVELKDIALRLVAAGIGDTYLPSAYTRAPCFPDGLHTAPFSPALHDTFGHVTRHGARLSAGVRELLAPVEGDMRMVAAELDRSR